MLARTETPRVIRLGPPQVCDLLGPRWRVMVDGEIYARVNKYLLAALEDGMSPDDLQLEPDADEPDEWWPGSPDEDSTMAFASRRGWR